jgi:hypothetical protein
MRKLILSAALALLTAGVSAQSKKTKTDSELELGIRGGISLAKYSGKGIYDVDYKNNNLYFATLFADLKIKEWFLLQPGVSFQHKGARYSTTAITGSALPVAKLKQKVAQIEVPINLIFNINTGSFGAFQVNVGPYVGYNLYGKNKKEGNFYSTWGKLYTGGSTELNFGDDMADDLKPLDYGLNGGISYRTLGGFIVGANYGWGLSNLAPAATSGNKLENRVLSFSIGSTF